jgi:hypothetical protein
MQNITNIEKYGQNSFAKARAVKPRAYRRKSVNYFAFTIQSERADGPRYIVRIAIESRSVFAECLEASTGEACKGFSRFGHCYHVGRALLLA